MKTKSISHATGSRDHVRLGVRGELFLIVFICFGILMTVIVGSIHFTARREADRSVRNSLNISEHVLRTRLESRYRSIQETAKSLVVDSRLRPLIYANETADVRDLLSEFEASLGFDIMIITDEKGRILGRSDKPDAVGRSVTKSPLFQSALTGTAAHGFMRVKDDHLQIVALPVVDNVATDIVQGSLGLAYRLSQEVIEEISRLTSCEIVLFSVKPDSNSNALKFRDHDISTIADTKTTQDFVRQLKGNSAFLQSLAKSPEKQPLKKELKLDSQSGTQSYVALFYPLQTSDGRILGFASALRSKTALLAPFQAIISSSLLIALLCLLLGLLLAYLVSQRISRPIIELTGVAEHIEEGHYPEPKSNPRENEVGRLYRTVFRMGKALQRKEELEDYLAGFVEETEGVGEFTEEKSVAAAMSKNDSVKPESLPLQLNVLFDSRYQIKEVLGAGGMGVVYLATDVALEEPLAVKVIDHRLRSDQAEGLKHELKLARRITHNNVVRTYDFGVAEGLYYITMEYVPGATLRSFIKKNGPVEFAHGVIMLRQICSAVAAAHAQGIIHRDLKADNIIINRRGVLKVMDFGIATIIHPPLLEDSPEGNMDTVEDVTGPVKVSGTPAYMAPEQFSTDSLDERCDVYALGVIVFYTFTGQFPFPGKNFLELALQHREREVPPITELNDTLPPALNEVVRKAMAKNREERFANMRELSSALAELA